MQINRFLFEITCQNLLGENVLWHNTEQALYWTDIEGKTLYKCVMTSEVTDLLADDSRFEEKRSYLDQVLQVFDLPHRLASFAFTQHTDTLLAAFDLGLALFRYSTGELTWLNKLEHEKQQTRLNDGKCDPLGRFWVGSMAQVSDAKNLDIEEQASLYKCELSNQKLTVVNQLNGLHISNSLCFSKDAKLMYHSDSTTHRVYQYQLSENGNLLHKKLFAKFDKHSFPDGACVDIKGNVWIALWGGACVVCISPQGKEILRLPLPVTQATCVALGGPKGNWLFVSSAKAYLSEEKLDKQARAGNLFVYELSEAFARPEATMNIDTPHF